MIPALVGALGIGLALGLLGSGGSILTVPILVYLLGHDEKPAIAEALAIVASIALAGAALQRANIRWRAAALFAIPGVVGAAAGARASILIPGAGQLTLLGAVMLAAAMVMFFRREPAPGEKPAPTLTIAASGAGVGVLTGLVGVGGGFLIVPALVALASLPMRSATATSLAIIALHAGSGFIASLTSFQPGELHWGIMGAFAGIGVTGAILGQRLGAHLSQRVLRRAFAGFLLVLAGFIGWREVPRIQGRTHAPDPASEPGKRVDQAVASPDREDSP